MKFKVKSLKLKVKNSGILFLIIFSLFTLNFSLLTAAEKWPGADESVVEKFAKEHGREAMEPLINTDQGDLLLFVFLTAGTVGGFVAGYYWRTLITQRAETKEQKKEK